MCGWSDRNLCIDFVQTIDLGYGKLYFDSEKILMSPEIKYTKVTTILNQCKEFWKLNQV